MANNVGNLKVKLNLDSAAYEYGINQCVNSTKVLGQALGALGIGISAAKIVDIGKQALKASSDFEQAGVSFSVMLGDAKKAKRLVNDLQNMANVTPFETQDLLDASKTLLNFGISAKEVMPDLQMLGDIAGGDKQRMQSLTLAFSQMSSAGRLMGQDLLQMVNAGFNPLEEIARKTGKSIGYWKDEMSKGNVSVEMVRQAFIDATSEGGRFYKMMDKQSETLEGRLSTMNDAYVLLLRSISDGFVPSLKDGAIVMTDVINNTTNTITKFNEWVATNSQLVGGIKDLGVAVAVLAVGIPLTNSAVVAIIASMRNFGTVTAKTTAFQIAFATYLKGDTALAMLQFRTAISATIIKIRELTIALAQCPLTWVAVVLGAGAAAWWAYQQNVKSTQRAIEDLNSTQEQQVNKTSEAIQVLKELDGASGLNYEQTKRLDSAIQYLTDKYPAYIDKLRNELRLKGEISKATAEQIANEMMLAKVKGLQEQRQKLNKDMMRDRKISSVLGRNNAGGRYGITKANQKRDDALLAEQKQLEKERKSIVNELTLLNKKQDYSAPATSTSNTNNKKKKGKTDKQLAAEAKAAAREALEYKLAMLDVEKYQNEKTQEEIFKIELEKANLKIASAKKGTSEYAHALAEKLQLEREHEKSLKDMQSQKVVDDLAYNKQELDNKLSLLQLEYDAHKISKTQMLQTEIQFINQKKQLELAALQEQLKLVQGNTAEEVKIKRASQKLMEDYNIEANRKALELWEHQHEAFKNVTSDISSGWGSTVTDLLNGNLTFEGALNSMLDTVLDSFGTMCGTMVQNWVADHLTMETVTSLFGAKKVAVDQLINTSNAGVIASNTARTQSEGFLSTVIGLLTGQQALQATANTAVATTATAAATAQGTAAGTMTAASGVMATGITAILAPTLKLSAAMAALALSSGASGLNMSIVAIATGMFALEAALASLSALMLNVSLGVLAGTSLLAAKGMANLAVANAANSAAMIPFVGWMIAPGAATATGIGISAGSAMVQFREKGGDVKAGQPYIVGEKRPELFIPDRNGTILPDLSALNSSGNNGNLSTVYNTPVTISVQANDAASFASRIDELTDRIHSNLEKKIKRRQLSPLGSK